YWGNLPLHVDFAVRNASPGPVSDIGGLYRGHTHAAWFLHVYLAGDGFGKPPLRADTTGDVKCGADAFEHIGKSAVACASRGRLPGGDTRAGRHAAVLVGRDVRTIAAGFDPGCHHWLH